MNDTADDAFKRIVRILNASDQSEANIRVKLSHAGYSQSPIDDAVDRALEYHLIDDERYTRLYIQSKLRSGKGMDGILRELGRMHIDPYSYGDPDIISVLSDSGDSELDRALSLLSRKPPRGASLVQSAYSKLVRNGYSSQIAAIAARRWLEQTAD